MRWCPECGDYSILAQAQKNMPTLGVPGEQLPKVTHYYRDPAFYAFQDVLVVGANNSAVDAALECWRKGARVTMVVREAEIGKLVKYWARPDIVNRIEEGSITAFFNSNVQHIDTDTVTLATPSGPTTIANHFVLAMTGYQPNFDLLQRWGVQCNPENNMHPTHNPDTMQTTIRGLYLAGVVCGGMDTHLWFIENSREHANKIVQHILSAAT